MTDVDPFANPSEGDSLPPAWLIVTGTVVVLGLILIVGWGFGAGWGAPQWGPLAEWVAGVATLAAVVVALRESFRAQRESMRGQLESRRAQLARLVDHEVSRRRECIKALGDLWAALVSLNMDFRAFKEKMDSLPTIFSLSRPAGELQPPGREFGDEIAEDIVEFITRWSDKVEPPLFVALAVLHGTPMESALEQVKNETNWIKGDGIKAILEPVLAGQRPDTAQFTARWNALLRSRYEHLTLAHQHFSLTRDDVETSVRQSWSR